MLGRFGRLRSERAKTQNDVARDSPTSTDHFGDGVGDLLADIAVIEAAACQVYRRHGLPDQPGHYRRRDEDSFWEKVADNLSPAEIWAMVDAAPSTDGWRFTSLERLGQRSAINEVRQASALLDACRGLRQRLAQEYLISPQDLADALRLGASWRRLSTQEGETGADQVLSLPAKERSSL